MIPDALYQHYDHYPFYGLECYADDVLAAWDDSRQIVVAVAYAEYFDTHAIQAAHDALMAYVESAPPETFSCGLEKVLVLSNDATGTDAGYQLAESLFDEIDEIGGYEDGN